MMEQEEEKLKENTAEKQGAAGNDEPLITGNGITSTESRRLREAGLPLWEKLENACKDVNIDQYSDYSWPEERKFTEDVVRDLNQKRILFIESFTEAWAFRALQRLATVMYTMNEEGGLLLRINNGAELTFGFWINERPLPCPVVVIIPSNRYDFFQKFTTQKNALDVIDGIVPELRKLNLYIVCQLPGSGTGPEKLADLSNWMKNAYAQWRIPVVKLELNKRFGQEGPALYNALHDKIKKHGSHAIGWELITRTYQSPAEVIELLENHIAESAIEVKQRKNDLVALVNSRNFLPKLLVFCGSYFHGLHYKDFHQLVARLLHEEQTDDTPSLTEPNGKQLLTLRQQWEKDADYHLRECALITTRKEGNHRVEFAVPGLAELMADYISNECYPFFHRVYRNFEQASLMSNLNLSKDLEKSLILLFARAAKMDTITYSAEWLKNEVCTLWEEYSEEVTDKIESYEDLFFHLNKKKFFGDLVFSRVPLMISGLLTENNDVYKEIIKEFFRLLLNEPDARKMAIIIASDLYKKFRATDTFDINDLMSYFRKTLEGNNSWEDRFFTYDALRDCLEADDMRSESDLWLTGQTETSETLIMQFARLYQLDSILETYYRFFSQYKGIGTYELWDGMEPGMFPETFEQLLKNLLSENSVKNLSLVLENRNNLNQLSNRIMFIEGLETKEIIIATARLAPENLTAVSLLADITETWFYLLAKNTGILNQDTEIQPEWAAYMHLLAKHTNIKTLRKLRQCWQLKMTFYMAAIQALQPKATKKGKRASYVDVLLRRRSCLQMMARLIKKEQEYIPGTFSLTTKS